MPSETSPHAGRTYVVTGAASGIGLATTIYLRNRGARVVSSDLHAADVIADLATPAGRAALVNGVARACSGRVDGIVANAGGGPPSTMLALNFFGAVATLEGLWPMLAGGGAPRAVMVSSIASLTPPDPDLLAACLKGDEAAAEQTSGRKVPDGDGLTLYANAKAALNAWCRREAISAEWAGAGIPLNSVALGFFDTPAAHYILSDAALRSQAEAMIPLRGGFPGDPADAAAALAWMVGPENRMMTGQVLYLDGGAECLARKAAA